MVDLLLWFTFARFLWTESYHGLNSAWFSLNLNHNYYMYNGALASEAVEVGSSSSSLSWDLDDMERKKPLVF